LALWRFKFRFYFEQSLKTPREEAMKISVALCTYNGERFLRQQLESITQQTQTPDELVVCDDGSTDSTPAIIQQFATDASFPVKLNPNPTRLGVTKNFERAIGLCSGDMIVLADQDDVWQPEKLARLHRTLNTIPQVGAAFSNANLIDGAGQPLGTTLWRSIRFTPREQRAVNSGDALPVLLKHRVVTGAALAFRADLRDRILPIPEIWVHDAWIAFIAALFTDLCAIPDPLILYRQHERNVIGAAATMGAQIEESLGRGRDSYVRNAQQYTELKARIEGWQDIPDQAHVLHLLDEKIAHIRARAYLPHSRVGRIAPILRELARGNYQRYSMGWQSAAKDLLSSA
jgi:glycosyltransferase involved in cell wall biosynthesis